jgi:hypothetical protein
LLLSSDTRTAAELAKPAVGAVPENQDNERFNSANA